MKKSMFLFFFLTTLTIFGFGQTKCDIINHYNDFIQIQKTYHDGEGFINKTIVEAERKSCFSDLINNNPMFIDYLLTCFSSNANNQKLLNLTDSITLNKTFISDLQNDSLFNSVMTELVRKVIEDKTSKDTLSMDDLLNIAVKFFSIIKIDDNDNYVGQVCIGTNIIKKTEAKREPFIEAFCFSSILIHYFSEEFKLYDEFVNSITELYKVNLGIDKEERLFRAQGAMFLLMRNNESLIKMLKSEYENEKDYLPFILID